MDERRDRRYVVLLIGTLAGPGPATEFLRLSRQQPSFFHLVVPATVPQYGWTWTEGQALADAQERIQIMTEFGSAMGLNVRAEVLPTDDPVDAVRRVVRNASELFDELIVIDRAKGISRWLEDRALDELRRTRACRSHGSRRIHRFDRGTNSTCPSSGGCSRSSSTERARVE